MIGAVDVRRCRHDLKRETMEMAGGTDVIVSNRFERSIDRGALLLFFFSLPLSVACFVSLSFFH